MASIQERYKLIQASVLGDAQAQADALLRQAEEMKSAAMKRAENEVLHQLYDKIQEEISQIHTASTQAVSRQEAQARHDLLLKREEITQKVFRQVHTRLVAYTRTPDSARRMMELARKLAENCPLEGSVVMLRGEDYHFSAELEKILGKGCRILADETIRIGGLKLMNQTAGIFVDETLDSRLEDQKPYFYSHAGLSVT